MKSEHCLKYWLFWVSCSQVSCRLLLLSLLKESTLRKNEKYPLEKVNLIQSKRWIFCTELFPSLYTCIWINCLVFLYILIQLARNWTPYLSIKYCAKTVHFCSYLHREFSKQIKNLNLYSRENLLNFHRF